MLCRRCERRLWSPKLLQFWTSPPSVWGVAPLGDLICLRCGAVLPPELTTERFLARLSQLGQFGLGAAGGPLLRPDGEER